MLEPARKPKLLADYAPPDYLIEAVELDVALDPKDARVAAKLRVKPNPKAATGGRPLVLDGEGLVLKSLALERQASGARGLRRHGDRAHHHNPSRPNRSRSTS